MPLVFLLDPVYPGEVEMVSLDVPFSEEYVSVESALQHLGVLLEAAT